MIINMDYIKRFLNKTAQPVSYDGMLKIETIEPQTHEKGITRIRIEGHRSANIIIIEEFEKGAKEKEHYHDSKEVVQVIYGEVTARGRTYKKGDKFYIFANVLHAIEAKEKTQLFVEHFKTR